MVKIDQEICTSRSASRHFLVCRTDSKLEEVIDPRSSVVGSLLIKAFPSMLVGLKFLEHTGKVTEDPILFAALVVRIDPRPGLTDDDAEKDRTDFILGVAGALEKKCREENGIWGLLGHGIFGCCFPGKDAAKCLNIAEEIQKDIKDKLNGSVSLGIADYPTSNFQKQQIMENARKALDHADFFGPGSRVCFDSVSLNISGDQLYQAGDIDGAIEEFKEALLLDPLNINVHNSLGVCYGEIGKLSEALESFETALRIDDREVMAVYNAGLVRLLMGEKEKALDCFLEANRIEPDIFEVLLETGKLYLEKMAYDTAKGFLEKTVELNPDSGSAFRYLGECCVAQNDTAGAVSAYQKAIKRNPNDAASLSALGELFDRMGENSEIAEMFCKQSVDIAPDNALYTYRLGHLYFKNERIDEALSEFEKAAALGYDASEFIEKIHQRKVKGLNN